LPVDRLQRMGAPAQRGRGGSINQSSETSCERNSRPVMFGDEQ
jgi:hypothetical protein